MNNKTFQTKQLYLSEVRFFNKARESSIIPSRSGYTILGKFNEKYINVFQPDKEYPVYGRLPYSNVTSSGESYGTMITLVSGEIQDGPCYILDQSLNKIISKEEVSMEELKKMVLKSKKYFLDRKRIIEEKGLLSRFIYHNTYLKDKEFEEEFKEYMNTFGYSKQFRK